MMVHTHFDDMDDAKLVFARNIYIVEYLVDQIESKTMQIEAYAKQNGLYMHQNKQAINKAKYAIKAMCSTQRAMFGDGALAESFGANCDRISELLEFSILLDGSKQHELIELAKKLNEYGEER